jgi:hypothetical protein
MKDEGGKPESGFTGFILHPPSFILFLFLWQSD